MTTHHFSLIRQYLDTARLLVQGPAQVLRVLGHVLFACVNLEQEKTFLSKQKCLHQNSFLTTANEVCICSLESHGAGVTTEDAIHSTGQP